MLAQTHWPLSRCLDVPLFERGYGKDCPTQQLLAPASSNERSGVIACLGSGGHCEECYRACKIQWPRPHFLPKGRDDALHDSPLQEFGRWHPEFLQEVLVQRCSQVMMLFWLTLQGECRRLQLSHAFAGFFFLVSLAAVSNHLQSGQ